jgi:hypothetical protein
MPFEGLSPTISFTMSQEVTLEPMPLISCWTCWGMTLFTRSVAETLPGSHAYRGKDKDQRVHMLREVKRLTGSCECQNVLWPRNEAPRADAYDLTA